MGMSELRIWVDGHLVDPWAPAVSAVDLGITVVELMPVNQFPGERGWGYDGIFWAAALDSDRRPRTAGLGP